MCMGATRVLACEDWLAGNPNLRPRRVGARSASHLHHRHTGRESVVGSGAGFPKHRMALPIHERLAADFIPRGIAHTGQMNCRTCT